MNRVFSNGPGNHGSIPGRVIPKTQKMVLNTSLLNTQHYKIRIQGKVDQSQERNSALPYTSVIEKEAFGSPSTEVANFTYSKAKYSQNISITFLKNVCLKTISKSFLL